MNFFRYSSPSTFYPLAGKLIPWFGWSALLLAIVGLVDRLRSRAHRLPAGRGLSHHLHPRRDRMDVDVHLCRDGVLERAVAGLQHAPVGHDGAGAGADRRPDDVHRVVDRRALGPADVGNVLGVGCADDLRADPAVPLFRRDRAAQRHRRRPPRGPRMRRCSRWSAWSTFRSSISPCSGGTRCTRGRRSAWSRPRRWRRSCSLGMLVMAIAVWFYSIAVALMRVRCIILERERGAAWTGQLPPRRA